MGGQSEQPSIPPLLGGILSAALMLLSTFSGQFLPFWLQASLYLIGAGLFLCFIWWILWHYRDNWGGCVLAFTFLVGTAIGGAFIWVGISGAYRHYHPAPMPQGLPKLRVRLVPEFIVGTRLNFHITVENRGPGDIEVVRYNLQSPGDYEADEHSADRKVIAEGDELSFTIRAYNRMLEAGGADLEIAYTVAATGQLRTAKYRFTIPESVSGPIAPTNAFDRAGRGDLYDERTFVEKRLAQDEGAIRFAFRERLEGQYNNFGYSKNGRSISVRPDLRVVVFSALQNGLTRTIQGTMQVTLDGRHVVTVAWADDHSYVAGGLDGKPMVEVAPKRRSLSSGTEAHDNFPPP